MQNRLLTDTAADRDNIQIQINIQVVDLYSQTVRIFFKSCENFFITVICQAEYLQPVVSLPVLTRMLCNNLCKTFRTAAHSPVTVHLFRLLRICAHIAVLTRCEMISAEKFSVEDNSACNAGTQNNNRSVCTALKASSPELGKCRTFSIVFYRNLDSVTFGKLCSNCASCKICKISRGYTVTVLVVQHTRHADGNPFDAVSVFFYNTVQNRIIVLFCLCSIVRCRNFIFFKNFCIFVH